MGDTVHVETTLAACKGRKQVVACRGLEGEGRNYGVQERTRADAEQRVRSYAHMPPLRCPPGAADGQRTTAPSAQIHGSHGQHHILQHCVPPKGP